MDTAQIANDLDNIDYAAIDKHARQLRAEAVRDTAKSVKAFFAGFGFTGQAASRPRVNYGVVKGTGAFL